MSGGKRKRGVISRRKSQPRDSRARPNEVDSWSAMVAPMLRQSQLRNSMPSDTKRPVLEFASYEITDEPIHEDCALYGMTEQDYARMLETSQEFHQGNPARMISRLEALVREFPRCPLLYNHLAGAYQAAGRSRDVDRMIRDTYRLFPDYLFAIANYAQLRMAEGHPEEVPEICHGRLALHLLLPGRKKYHITEAVNFFSMMACYFAAIHDPLSAAKYLDMLEQLHPDHPATENARTQMLLCLSEFALGDD